MKALIVGGGGFVGGYLRDHLLNDMHMDVYITKLCNQKMLFDENKTFDLDILNYDDIVKLLNKIQPDYIFHLVAQSSVAVSWKNPNLTVNVNVSGAINLLEAVKSLGLTSQILLVGSSEEYGKIDTLSSKDGLISENEIINPCNIYAATKACQNMIGKIYSDAYGLDIMMVRAFNHFGPKQEQTFVISDFCKQVAMIEIGKQDPIINVGNLKAKRDFTDVRDIVKAYSALVQKGLKGQTYNVGSGEAKSIEEILNIILSMSKTKIDVKIDQDRFRPIDVPVIRADISKIVMQTGWKPHIDIKQTIEDTLNYWRDVIRI